MPLRAGFESGVAKFDELTRGSDNSLRVEQCQTRMGRDCATGTPESRVACSFPPVERI